MAGFDFAAIRDALAAALERATDLRRVYPYLVDAVSTTELPAAYIGLPSPTLYSQRFTRTGGGEPTETTVAVTIVAARVNAEGAQAAFDRLLSGRPIDPDESGDAYVSIIRAIRADRTLDGTCSDVLIERADNARVVTAAGAEYLAVDLVVRIFT